MTKYILYSGGSNPEKASLFNNEILKGLGVQPKILFCFFARAREDWEELFDKYKNNFLKTIEGNIKPEMELAFPDKFSEQVKKNDVVILLGGDDYLLQYWLNQYSLPKIWEGKVVASSSAGSNALVNSFWTCDWRKSIDGLNILPIKFISHFNSNFGDNDPRGKIDWKKAYKEISEYGNKSLEVNALEEGDFMVIEK